ncbi:hypothetical protein M885DRAFT_570851 [Pelagophyceae sp. CCMP2097]|nr:hypothetical protein M885DRAFT_570851 [Pelagophyceae sp. CCMP2097]
MAEAAKSAEAEKTAEAEKSAEAEKATAKKATQKKTRLAANLSSSEGFAAAPARNRVRKTVAAPDDDDVDDDLTVGQIRAKKAAAEAHRARVGQ